MYSHVSLGAGTPDGSICSWNFSNGALLTQFVDNNLTKSAHRADPENIDGEPSALNCP